MEDCTVKAIHGISQEEAKQVVKDIVEGRTESESRYSALGIDIPDPDKICSGKCEGTGIVPVSYECKDVELLRRWREAELNAPSDDGYHFVKCPICEGTGVKPSSHTP